MSELRIGVVGTGGIGRSHIERINTKLQGGRVTACADVNEEFCRKVADKYGIRAEEERISCRAGEARDDDRRPELFLQSALACRRGAAGVGIHVCMC